MGNLSFIAAHDNYFLLIIKMANEALHEMLENITIQLNKMINKCTVNIKCMQNMTKLYLPRFKELANKWNRIIDLVDEIDIDEKQLLLAHLDDTGSFTFINYELDDLLDFLEGCKKDKISLICSINIDFITDYWETLHKLVVQHDQLIIDKSHGHFI